MNEARRDEQDEHGITTRWLQIPDDVERLILVSDVHAITQPLDVLDEIVPDGSDTQIIAGGDYCMNGLRPAEALHWVRQRCGPFAILGNHDMDALCVEERGMPIYTDGGSYDSYDDALRSYLAQMPHALELTWKGKRICVRHHLSRESQWIQDQGSVEQVVETMTDTTVDLTVCAHTHYPFVKHLENTIIANCGAASALLLGKFKADGSIIHRCEGDGYDPDVRQSSSYLEITIQQQDFQIDIHYFQYSHDAILKELADIGHPRYDQLERMYLKSLYPREPIP